MSWSSIQLSGQALLDQLQALAAARDALSGSP